MFIEFKKTMKKTILSILILLPALSFANSQTQNSDDLMWERVEELLEMQEKVFDQFLQGEGFQEFEKMVQEMEKNQHQMMQNLQQNVLPQLQQDLNSIIPQQNSHQVLVKEDDQKIEYQIKVKDIDQSEINLNIENQKITIQGKTHQKKNQSHFQNQFKQEILIPFQFNPDQVEIKSNQEEIIVVVPKPYQGKTTSI
jgi:HSP20 family molecular chaperone IbpA